MAKGKEEQQRVMARATQWAMRQLDMGKLDVWQSTLAYMGADIDASEIR